jgi:hypothetical protein
MRANFLDLVGALLEQLPKPDPEVRRARLMGRLTTRRHRLRAELASNPQDAEKAARLAGVEAEIEVLQRAIQGGQP